MSSSKQKDYFDTKSEKPKYANKTSFDVPLTLSCSPQNQTFYDILIESEKE